MSGFLLHLKFKCIRAIVNTSLYIRQSAYFSPETQPDRIKVYAGRSNLFASRIFIPRKGTSSLQEQQLFPLVICTHGGGFIVNNPATDDPLARHIADSSRCVVVSIDYSKSPQSKFPVAYEDIVQISLDVMNDSDLPIDGSKVFLLGSSAGGNLMLAVSQDSRLRSKIMGVMGLYPACDLVPSASEKLSTRPDPSIPDFLGANYDNIANLYLKKGTDALDPRISPSRFSSRNNLPDNVFLLGCEHDMLCHEVEEMAKRLAETTSKIDQEWNNDWQAEGIRWHKVMGQTHAFNHFSKKDAKEEEQRLAATEATYKLMAKWLSEAFYTSPQK